MKKFLRTVHLYYFQVWLALMFSILYPVIFLSALKPVNFSAMNYLRWLFSYSSSLLSGFIYRFSFESEINRKQNYIVCANHTSNLDITAMILLLKQNVVFVGKDELLDNFITGIYFRAVDIPLNRDSKISAFRAFQKAGEKLKEGKNVVIFPEGMISESYPPVLKPFKNGPFKLAIEQGIPILPVTICNNWNLMWDDGSKYGSKPGICDICIHAPIETTGMTGSDSDLLKNEVYSIIQNKLNSFSDNKLQES